VKVSRPPEVAAAPPVNSPGSIPFASGGGAGSIMIPLRGNSMRSMIIPPGGFAGFAQQTPATQALFQRAGRIGGRASAAKRRKKRATAKRAAPKRSRKVARRGVRAKKARLVKGSAAAKRYMASIRRKRRK
jgi:hypothetical protein